jgi:hypothetical protein
MKKRNEIAHDQKIISRVFLAGNWLIHVLGQLDLRACLKNQQLHLAHTKIEYAKIHPDVMRSI